MEEQVAILSNENKRLSSLVPKNHDNIVIKNESNSGFMKTLISAATKPTIKPSPPLRLYNRNKYSSIGSGKRASINEYNNDDVVIRNDLLPVNDIAGCDKRIGEMDSLADLLVSQLEASINANKDTIMKTKAIFSRFKERTDEIIHSMGKLEYAHSTLLSDCMKLRAELRQRKIQLRMRELHDGRRPRLMRGEPSSLLVQDTIWPHDEFMRGDGRSNTSLRDFSNVRGSLIELTAKPLLNNLKECTYDAQVCYLRITAQNIRWL